MLFKPLPNGVGEVEVGWHLHPDSWGRGYATEAARAVIAQGFEAGLPEVYAVVHGRSRRRSVRSRVPATHGVLPRASAGGHLRAQPTSAAAAARDEAARSSAASGSTSRARHHSWPLSGSVAIGS